MCPHGKYKAEVGDGLCEPCPEHSKAGDYGLEECRCNNGYYRAPKDSKNASCTRKPLFFFTNIILLIISCVEPPSAPQNLSVIFVDQSNVILSWLPPEYQGGRTDTKYRIKCDVCPAGLVQYIPSSVSSCKNLKIKFSRNCCVVITLNTLLSNILLLKFFSGFL